MAAIAISDTGDAASLLPCHDRTRIATLARLGDHNKVSHLASELIVVAELSAM
jgi:hypothetical protein